MCVVGAEDSVNLIGEVKACTHVHVRGALLEEDEVIDIDVNIAEAALLPASMKGGEMCG